MDRLDPQEDENFRLVGRVAKLRDDERVTLRSGVTDKWPLVVDTETALLMSVARSREQATLRARYYLSLIHI